MATTPDYFSEGWLRDDLKGKTVRGGVFTGAAQAIQVGVQLAAIPILARLLTPADFGLIAMVSVVTGFANMFIDAGLSTATIQRDRITHGQVSNLFWLATGLGTAMAVGVALLSPAIAWFYGEPRLVPITLALVLSFVFTGLTIQHQALLRRAMQFRALSVVQVGSVVAGQGTGILWAWMYRDYWALVWIPVASAFVRMLGTWYACRWLPGGPERGTRVRPLVSFGAYLTGFNVVNYLARNMDYALIGWYWGATPLGLYERAYRILLFPLQQLNAPMSTVAVPALSRLVSEPNRYRSFWRKGSTMAAYVQFPIVAVAVLAPHELTAVLLGPEWGETVPVLQALIPAMLLSFTAPATSWVFTSWGRPDKQLKMALVCSIITLGGFAASVPFGIVALAWTFSISQVLIRPFCIAYCFAGTPLRWKDFWVSVRVPVLATLAAMPLTLAILYVMPVWDSAFARLVFRSGLFAVLYVAMTMVTAEGRAFLRQLEMMLLEFHFGRRKAHDHVPLTPAATVRADRK